MKIIYILPSLNIRGSDIIFEQVRKLAKKGHDVVITSLDEAREAPNEIIPTKLDTAKKDFESADAIIAYNPVCAFYVNDIEDTKARKYCLLLNDERDYYTHDYIKAINKLDGYKLDNEYDKQKRFIEASYDLPLHFIVSNPSLEKELVSRGRKVTVMPTGVDPELFYPEVFVPKGEVIRIITDGNQLPWNRTDITSRALSQLHDFELWTFGSEKPQIRVDKHWGVLNEEMQRKLFSSCDIYIDMNVIDGTAEMALKAMACGCAVIARKTSGGESVYLDGKNSMIIDGESDEELVDSLTAKTNELMTNKQLLETLIRGGLETVKPMKIENLEKGLKRK